MLLVDSQEIFLMFYSIDNENGQRKNITPKASVGNVFLTSRFVSMRMFWLISLILIFTKKSYIQI